MKTQKRILYAVAVGFAALLFWNSILFWVNFYYNMAFTENTSNAKSATAGAPVIIEMQEPNELVNQALINSDYRPGSWTCKFYQNDFLIFRQMGILDFFLRSGTEKSQTRQSGSKMIEIAYAKTLRQLVVREIDLTSERPMLKNIGYIGPKGYSTRENPDLGTFGKPLLARDYSWFVGNDTSSQFLYDIDSRRFYRIDMEVSKEEFKNQTYFNVQLDSIRIVEGPVQEQSGWNPVKIGWYIRSGHTLYPEVLRLEWKPPYRVEREPHPVIGSEEEVVEKTVPIKDAPRPSASKPGFLVLHQDGRIDHVDGETLTVVKTAAAFLPELGFYEHSRSRRPRDMADCTAMGLYDPNGLHLKTIVAALGRDGFTMALDFYDANGNLRVHRSLGNSDGVGFLWDDISGGAFYLTFRYLMENMQSPLLRLLDLPAASWMEPGNRYSTLFVHPNSFVGLMKIEPDHIEFWSQLLLLMLPSLMLSSWLGIKARRKAALLGYDTTDKDIWFIAILAFGIPAYITFKLMLPKEKMITCANCGNLRRVEFDVCQSCKRDWQKTKTLTTPPNWSVKDLAKAAADNPSVSEGARQE